MCLLLRSFHCTGCLHSVVENQLVQLTYQFLWRGWQCGAAPYPDPSRRGVAGGKPGRNLWGEMFDWEAAGNRSHHQYVFQDKNYKEAIYVTVRFSSVK